MSTVTPLIECLLRSCFVLFGSLFLAVLFMWPGIGVGQEVSGNMLGAQSQNSGLTAVPAPGVVIIDGDLEEWDLSGRIWSFADYSLRDEYSVETAAMWDADYFYLGLRWRDLVPLDNDNDPAFSASDGWRGDALQMRVKTDQVLWMTAWQYAGKATSNMVKDVWNNPLNSRDGTESTQYFGKPGEVDLGDGIQMAYRHQDYGYTQEIRLPWRVLYEKLPDVKAGMVFKMGYEFLWGKSNGKGAPMHRYADNMQPGATSREFFWTSSEVWGDVVLSAEGNVPLRTYGLDTRKVEYPIKIDFEIPLQANRFTIVIEDAMGKRVRNLYADCDPADFADSVTQDKYQLQVSWDGCDDAGSIVEPGVYQVRGLWHEGLDALFDMTFYNPGTPSWATRDGTGSWGSDHYPPRGIVAAGDRMVVSWDFAEGGSGLIGLGPDGRKMWGDVRGSLVTAGNGKYVYSIMADWQSSGNLGRFMAADGSYAPFELNGEQRPFALALTDIIPEAPQASGFLGVDQRKDGDGFVRSMAANKQYLAMGLEDQRLALLDADTAELLKIFPLDGIPVSLAFASDEFLYVVADGKLSRLDLSTGKVVAVSTPELGWGEAISVNAEGHIAVMDVGEDYQVKVYSPNGDLLSTIGQLGGRPERGIFEANGLSHVSSIAYDSKGRIWVVENWNYPRRVCVWSPDGIRIKDYVGNTAYSGAGSYLHSDDPTLAYAGPVEMKLNRGSGDYEVTRVLWKSDDKRDDEPLSFDVDPLSNVLASRFQSDASGRTREYMFRQPTYNHHTELPAVLFMEDSFDSWRPVAAVGLVGHISGKMDLKGREILEVPQGDFADLSAWDGFFWNDDNEDGRVQRSECAIIPSGKPSPVGSRYSGEPPVVAVSAQWNNTIDPQDLSWMACGIFKMNPVSFTEKGAPVYGPEGVEQLLDLDSLLPAEYKGVLVPIATKQNEFLIAIQTMSGALRQDMAFIGVGSKSKEIVWSYPNDYPGVHASHKAPMPAPGQLIGPLKSMGTVFVDDEIGEVIGLRGNLGQDFFFTTDGLYVGSLFRDARFPRPSMPATEEELRGKSLASFSEGGEPFSGWIGKQSDGIIRMTTSIARQAALVVEVTGLDSVRRFSVGDIEVTAMELRDCLSVLEKEAEEAANTSEHFYLVKRMEPGFAWDRVGSWEGSERVEASKMGSPEAASFQLAHDGSHLFLCAEVTDSSPMMNNGKDALRLFKSGDAIDLQLGELGAGRRNPEEGDHRLLISFFQNRPVAVLMRPVDKEASVQHAKTYASPVLSRSFDRVEILDSVRLKTQETTDGYVLMAAIPFSDLNIDPKSGARLGADLGFVSSDASGSFNIARTYWSNQDTGLVNDEPSESWFSPDGWGVIELE
ncbi:hypothetical protein [Puniceicoccus vermicola]|uniref:Uncharacterized protein n=1 Tax=Puniceicoccus vermicola TaxID=388746 RepID=A0A7X1B2G6_9BACT|nr:hypothetical protein [Puniceicoccus vermicola]MBC2604317.1 hypothetical protein [Puniceicoccus vermicola]